MARVNRYEKTSIVDVWDSNRVAHNMMINAMNRIKASDRAKIAQMLRVKEIDKKVNGINILKTYQAMIKALPRKYQQMELNSFMSGIIPFHEAYVKCYDDILANINKYIPEKEISYSTTDMACLVIFGIANKSSDFLSLSDAYFSLCMMCVSDTIDKYPTYRGLTIIDRAQRIFKDTESIIKISVNTNPVGAQIKQLRKSDQNLLMISRSDVIGTDYLKPGLLGNTIMSNIGSGVQGIRFLGRMGEAFETWKYEWVYRKSIINKEWIENHLELLNEVLAETDPNDPEYVRLQKVCKKYSLRIAELDRKINDYMEDN
ncbi:MAG: hypothetical protein GY804_08655 [Alphaproteobacteria bacterium]|nr:hypothetical protein [Alphaproteobacteria bacterium]